jgi:hypothetical protein
MATTALVWGRGGTLPVRAPRASVPSTVLPVEVLLRLQPCRLLPQSLHLRCAFDAWITPGVTSAWCTTETAAA